MIEKFHGYIQRGFRVQIPSLHRARLKLKRGAILEVTLTRDNPYSRQTFLARLQAGGRFTVPKAVREKLQLKTDSRELLEVDIKLLKSRLYGFMRIPGTRRRKRMQVYTAPGLSSER